MKLCELLHQGQTNAGAFVCATAGSLHAMKAVEQARDFMLGDATPGVRDREYCAAACLPQTHRDAT